MTDKIVVGYQLTFELFREAGVRRRWRWRAVSANGEIRCTSGESFASKRNARRAMESFVADVRENGDR